MFGRDINVSPYLPRTTTTTTATTTKTTSETDLSGLERFALFYSSFFAVFSPLP
jgi:hypothetical protein